MARDTLKALGPARLSWSAILAGSFFALGVMVLFGWLGLAIGLTVVEASPEASGIWLAVWIFVAPILALFLGGLLAGRFSGVTNRQGGAMHGAVTWGFTSLISAMLVWTFFTTMVGGVAAVGGAAAQATGAVLTGIGQMDPGQAMQTLGVDAQDLLGPVNQDRQEQGLPPLEAEQLQVAVQDAVGRSLQQGRINRAILVDSLVQNTAVTRPRAEELATRIETQVAQVGQDVGAAAQTALDALTSTAWFSFLSGLLALAAAAGGGSLGVSNTQREPLIVRPQPIEPGPGGEVYP